MLNLAPAAVLTEPTPDGGVVLRSPQRLEPYPQAFTDHLLTWADRTPNRTALAERRNGRWYQLSYRDLLAATEAVGQAMLDRRIGPERPVMILSGNGIDHAIVALAAMHIGAPTAPVSPAYALMSQDFGKLRHVYDIVQPALVFADDGAQFAAAIDALAVSDEALVFGHTPVPGRDGTALQDFRATTPTAAVGASHAAITSDTVAKILFTSGSTGPPKGVVNTHRMLCANQQSLAQVWPFLTDRPPRLIDWLPWNHTFGGNHNFGLVLRNGGTLYIDDGKPTAALMDRTIANLREVSPTIYFNVPQGLQMLATQLVADDRLAERFFADLRAVCFAGAALPPSVWQPIAARAEAVTGHVPALLSAWGSTETAPMATCVHYPNAEPNNIGLPGPGTEVKLAPLGDKLELRVRGPGIAPGYWSQPAMIAIERDADGFLPMGDAGRLADPNAPNRGLLFDGRTTENFKLASGTWVHVGALRLAAITAGDPLIQDAVVTGEDRPEVGLLVFLNHAACRDFCQRPTAPLAELISDATLRRHLTAGLAAHNRTNSGSSRRIARISLMVEPPAIDANEITDKGYLNQRAVLQHRAELVAGLYADDNPDVIILS